MKTACLQIQRNQGNDRYILQSWKLCLRRKTWSHRLNDGPSFKRDTFQIKRKQCFRDNVPCQVLQRSLRAMPSKFAILQRTHVVVFVSPHAIDVCCWLLFKGGGFDRKSKTDNIGNAWRWGMQERDLADIQEPSLNQQLEELPTVASMTPSESESDCIPSDFWPVFRNSKIDGTPAKNTSLKRRVSFQTLRSDQPESDQDCNVPEDIYI